MKNKGFYTDEKLVKNGVQPRLYCPNCSHLINGQKFIKYPAITGNGSCYVQQTILQINPTLSK